MDIEPWVVRSGAVNAISPTSGNSSPGDSLGNTEPAECGALTIVNANALAMDGAVKTLLPPGAEGAARPESCIKGDGPGRAWNVKGACMNENGAAAGKRKNGSPARLAKAGRVANDGDEPAPKAIVENAGGARGM